MNTLSFSKLTDSRLGLFVFLTACAVYAPTLRYGFLPGDAAWPSHLVNVLLHAGVCALLFKVLRRGASTRFSLAAALAFATLPVHVDAVAGAAGRPELLALLGMLGAWEFLGGETVSNRGRAAGLACFAAALLGNENAVFFPVAYACADWFTNGRPPWDARRRREHGGLWGLTLASLALRGLVLGRLFQGGAPYFADVTFGFKFLTLSRFWFLHYLIPTVSGTWQGADFSKPLIPLARLLDPVALLAALALVSVADLAVNDFIHLRSGWAFWSLIAMLFLLPTSHLLFPLDTLGAERFLYVPSLAWCAAVGWAAKEKVRGLPLWPAAAALLLWYGVRTVSREGIWNDPLSYYTAVVHENPAAPGTHYGLGEALLAQGRLEEAKVELREFLRLSPEDPKAADVRNQLDSAPRRD